MEVETKRQRNLFIKALGIFCHTSTVDDTHSLPISIRQRWEAIFSNNRINF
jgi:hypothetical protein